MSAAMERRQLVLYVHGKGGSAAEAQQYRPIFPAGDVLGFDYRAQTPWDAKEEFPQFFDLHSAGYDTVILIANSIGAFFSMHALADKPIERALFISPIVNMERLIADMMRWANVTEDALRRAQEIPTPFGETLSWPYLCYVRAHPIRWRIPTHILYGEHDALTAPETIQEFAHQTGATLTTMKNGEHWFHTAPQLSFLTTWLHTHTPSPPTPSRRYTTESLNKLTTTAH